MVAEPVAAPFHNRSSLKTAPSADTKPRGRALLEAHYHLIQKKLHHLSRRSGLPEHEAEAPSQPS